MEIRFRKKENNGIERKEYIYNQKLRNDYAIYGILKCHGETKRKILQLNRGCEYEEL